MDAERIVRELAERIAMEHYVQNPITRAAGLAKDIEKGLAPVRTLLDAAITHICLEDSELCSLRRALTQLEAAGKEQT